MGRIFLNLIRKDFQIQGEREAGYWFYIPKYSKKYEVKKLIEQILKNQKILGLIN